MTNTQKQAAKTAAQAMSNFVNPMNHDNSEFIAEMSNDHRTLQQAFTKLCLQWIEHVASSDYRTDGRNEQSKQTAERLIKGFADEDFKPSQYLHTI